MSFIGSLAAMGTTLATSALVGTGLGTAAGAAGAAGTAGLLGAGATATAGSILGGIGAGALTGSALGAGGAALTGGDVGEAAGMGALTGAVTGGITSGLGAAGNAATAAQTATPGQTLSGSMQTIGDTTQAVSSPVATQPAVGSANAFFEGASNPALQQAGGIMQSPVGAAGVEAQKSVADVGMLGKAGQAWNSLSPTGQMIGQGVAGLGVRSALDSAMAPDAAGLPTTPEDPWSKKFKYNQQFNYNSPYKYAAGGITDLDSYASQAQNIATGGITQIPNPAEVADPEGYGQESVRMMAGGGFTGRLMDSVGDNLIQNIPLAHAFGWDSASEIPLIGGLFSKPEALPATATLTPEEKQKLMAMMAAQQGQQQTAQQPQQMARGGIADLGDYAAGGRPNLLHGAGDGVSDDIPASIAGKQPARLAAGEYVVPSRIVSELGNGSTDAGAKRLDEMVQKVQAGRKKTMGSKKQFANDSKAYKHLPA